MKLFHIYLTCLLYAKALEVYEPSVVLLRSGFRLGNLSQTPLPRYREGSSLDPTVSQTVMNLGVGNWRLEPETAAYLVVPGRAHRSPWGMRDVLLRPYSTYLLDQVNITISHGKEAWLHISASAESLFTNATGRAVYELHLDGRVLGRYGGIGFRTLQHQRVLSGWHTLEVNVRLEDRDGLGCVCPSAGDGFQLSHHLATWWETVEKNPLSDGAYLVNRGPAEIMDHETELYLPSGNVEQAEHTDKAEGLRGWLLDFAMSIL